MALHGPSQKRSRLRVEGRRRGATSAWARTLVVSNWLCGGACHLHGPRPQALACTPILLPLRRSNCLPRCAKNSAAAAVGGRARRRLRPEASRRGGASATPLFPKHLALGVSKTWPCVRPSPSLIGLGAFRKHRQGFAPPSGAARGRVVEGPLPLCSRAWEVARGRRAFRELFPPPGGGGTLGAARGPAAQGERR